jgi:transforming growth factor-beta-induced protein
MVRLISAVAALVAFLSPAEASIRAANDRTLLTNESLVDIVVQTDTLSALEAALISTGLVSTLSGLGPFTVFAPDNDAFAAVPAKYLTADYIPHLKAILLYHVYTESTVFSTNLTDGDSIVMANGENLTVSIASGTITLSPALGGSAGFVSADVLASNGVAHIIDAILTPLLLTYDIPGLAAAGNFTTLLTALNVSGLLDNLSSTNDTGLTVLAPSNEAFAKLDNKTLATLLADPAGLAKILLYHVFPGIITFDEFTTGVVYPLNGLPLTVEASGSSLKFVGGLSSASVIDSNLLANNGIVHVIDTVLLPPVAKPSAPSPVPGPPSPTKAPSMAPPTKPKTSAASVVTATYAGAAAAAVGSVLAVMSL